MEENGKITASEESRFQHLDPNELRGDDRRRLSPVQLLATAGVGLVVLFQVCAIVGLWIVDIRRLPAIVAEEPAEIPDSQVASLEVSEPAPIETDTISEPVADGDGSIAAGSQSSSDDRSPVTAMEPDPAPPPVEEEPVVSEVASVVPEGTVESPVEEEPRVEEPAVEPPPIDLLVLARKEAEAGRLEEAEVLVRREMEQSPDRIEAYVAMAKVLELLTRYEEALALWDDISDRSSDAGVLSSVSAERIRLGELIFANREAVVVESPVEMEPAPPEVEEVAKVEEPPPRMEVVVLKEPDPPEIEEVSPTPDPDPARKIVVVKEPDPPAEVAVASPEPAAELTVAMAEKQVPPAVIPEEQPRETQKTAPAVADTYVDAHVPVPRYPVKKKPDAVPEEAPPAMLKENPVNKKSDVIPKRKPPIVVKKSTVKMVKNTGNEVPAPIPVREEVRPDRIPVIHIVEIESPKVRDRDDDKFEEIRSIQVRIKRRKSAGIIKPNSVKIDVEFFDQDERTGTIMRSRIAPESGLRLESEWSTAEERTLTHLYKVPNKFRDREFRDTHQRRTFYGVVVKVHHNGDFQDEMSSPDSLLSKSREML